MVVVIVNTMITLSTRVMVWWSHESHPETTQLPAAADRVLRARTGTADADVHVVLWSVAALALAWALRRATLRSVALAGAALWAFTGVLEYCQWVPGRTSSWIDFAGNAVGITIGLAFGLRLFRLIARRAVGAQSNGIVAVPTAEVHSVRSEPRSAARQSV